MEDSVNRFMIVYPVAPAYFLSDVESATRKSMPGYYSLT